MANPEWDNYDPGLRTDNIRHCLQNALWQMFAHNELNDLEKIDGNDHPRLLMLTDDALNRMDLEGISLRIRPEAP